MTLESAAREAKLAEQNNLSKLLVPGLAPPAGPHDLLVRTGQLNTEQALRDIERLLRDDASALYRELWERLIDEPLDQDAVTAIAGLVDAARSAAGEPEVAKTGSRSK